MALDGLVSLESLVDLVHGQHHVGLLAQELLLVLEKILTDIPALRLPFEKLGGKKTGCL